jgi:FKBP-type peptidyl-prolyl cis-trans isomerase SlyD
MAIENNQVVTIEFEVESEGSVIDSNIGQEPLQFTFGAGQIIPGLESRIAELSVGETAEIVVPAAEAFGEYNEEATQVIPKAQFQEADDLKPGITLQGQGEDGTTVQVVVKEILEEEIVIDFNHPLAGRDLTYRVKVLSLQ